MGVTVTTNLGLIMPDGDEKIQEDLPTYPGWADQNADNCDTLDSLFRSTSASWSPTWGGTSGNPVLGAGGFVQGEYVRIFPQLVIAHFRISAGGAGFAAGSGTYTLTLPFAVHPDLNALHNSVPVGKCCLYDASAVATSTNMVVMYSTTTNLIFFRAATGSVWSPTNPFTLAQNDRISGYILYPTQVA